MKEILNTFFPSNQREYAAYQQQMYSKMHDQETNIAGYEGYRDLGDATESLDVPAIFASHGVFTDWELGLNGYASNYISVPRNA